MRTPFLLSLSLLLASFAFAACEGGDGDEGEGEEGEGEEGEGDEGEGEGDEGEGEGDAAEGEGEGEGDVGEGEGEGEGDGGVLDVVDFIDDATIAAGDYLVDDDVSVSEGAVLTVEAGTTLRFTPGHELLVAGGTLVARGTADAPIVIAASEAGRGRFAGVQMLSDVGAGTVLEHVVVRGGGEVVNGQRGCLSISAAEAATVSLRDVAFEDCAVAGLGLDVGFRAGEESPFLAFSNVTVRRSDAGYFVDALLVHAISERITVVDVPHHIINGFNPPILRGGESWVGQGLPIDVDGSVEIADDGVTGTFTLDGSVDSLELRFDADQWLRVNGGVFGANGDVVLRGKAAGRGSWLGVVVAGAARDGTHLSGTVIDGGGQDSPFGNRGCLTLDDVAAGVDLSDVTLRNCGTAGLGVFGDRSVGTAANVDVEDSDAGYVADLRGVDGIPTLGLVRTTSNHIVINAQSIDRDVRVAAQTAPIEVDESIEVESGTFRVDGGATLQLHPQEWLHVSGGRLNVAGSAGTRAVFQRAEAQSAWIGIVIASGAPSGTSIVGARVEGGGAVDFVGSALAGGISIDAAGVSVDDVTFANNENADVTKGCDANPTITNTTGVIRDNPDCT